VSTGPVLFTTPLERQYWAARGYFVLIVDYRRSENYGPSPLLAEHVNADGFERDFDDINASIDAALARAPIDEDRLAVIGHSFGSAEVNWIVTHSDRFHAAVSYEGFDYFVSWGEQGKALSSLEWDLGGKSPLDAPEAYQREAAIFHARGPRHQRYSSIVSVGSNSRGAAWLSAALIRQGVDAALVTYKDEGHVIVKPQHQRDLLERVTAWIDGHLGYSKNEATVEN